MASSKKPSEMTLEELDDEIGARGERIVELRKEQQPFLRAKDRLVLKETESIRAAGAETLGDDRG